MTSAYITGFGVFMPNAPVGNEEMETVLGLINNSPSRSRKIILRKNGIKTRYYAIDPNTGKITHNNAQLTAEAIRVLAKNFNFPLNELECLVSGTSCPDQLMPNHAVMVHGELNSPPCEVVCTAGVCCSGATALKYGYMSVISGLTKNAIVTGSEVASKVLKAANFQAEIDAKVKDLEQNPIIAFEKDFLRWMLSDGAGAWLIENSPRPDGISLRIDWIDIVSFANELDACMYMGCEKRSDGSVQGWQEVENPQEVWENSYFAVKQDTRLLGPNVMPYAVKRAFESCRKKYGLKPEEITWFLPHYSSEFFKQELHDLFVEIGFPIPYEKWFTNLSWKGNTGSAAIYIILEELMSTGKVQKGDKVLCFIPESSRFSYSYVLLTAV